MYPHLWENHDLVTLLAWLDFSVAYKLDFWELITFRLDESRRVHTGEGYTFTKQQISNKLIGLPRRKSKPAPKLADILASGTACLPGLTRDILEEVKSQVKAFENDFVKSAGQDISNSSQNPVIRGERQTITRSNPVSLDIFSVLRRRVCF
jgi:hypothetical protein